MSGVEKELLVKKVAQYIRKNHITLKKGTLTNGRVPYLMQDKMEVNKFCEEVVDVILKTQKSKIKHFGTNNYIQEL